MGDVRMLSQNDFFLPDVSELRFNSNDWELSPYININEPIYYSYLVKRIDIDKGNVCKNPVLNHIPCAAFVDRLDASRVIRLFNATRHLSDRHLNELCIILLEQRDHFMKIMDIK